MQTIDFPFRSKILACGAQRQAGFCLTKKNCAFLINDLGNLDENSVLENYQREISRLKEELKIKPKVVTHDLHPEYSSTKYARGLLQKASGLKSIPIQHHQAHIASCIGENRIENKVIGVVFDSGGLGEDGQIWGGEFFAGNLKGFKRVAHLKYTSINGSYSSSVARLFDAVCMLVGLRDKLDYAGQGVANLERVINRSSHVAGRIYDFTLEQDKDKLLICPEPIFQSINQDLKNNISKSIISAAFHNTVIEIVRRTCAKVRRREKIKNVVLTGSVFANKTLFEGLKDLLSQDGFTVITHKRLSCNDSNISFGQAVLADARC